MFLGTVGVPTIALILLIALPFYDLRRERRPARAGRSRSSAPCSSILSMAMLTWKGATAKEALASEVIADVPHWVKAREPAAAGRARARSSSRSPAARPATRTSARGSSNLGAPDLTAIGTRNLGIDFQISHLKCPSCVNPGLADAEVRVARATNGCASSRSSSKPPRATAVAERAQSRGMHVFLGITGASGAPYAARLLEALAAADCEIGVSRVERRRSRCSPPSSTGTRGSRATRRSPGCSSTRRTRRVYDPNDWKAPYASGSAKVDAYVICPCSMGTLGTIASGAMQNLIHRAASVALKEERRLVLMPRETPLSAIHLRNMLTLREAGATILFLAPGFYHGAETVDDLVDFIVGARARPARAREHAREAVGTVSGASRPGRCPPRACSGCSTGSRRSTTR